ncbi:MAG: S8 family serine peptidase [Micromonosporaceae bacterium]
MHHHRALTRPRSVVTLLGVIAVLALSVFAALCGGPLAGPAYADGVRDGQWHLDYLGIRTAHRVSQGEGVTVAVVDTGVNPRHPDLQGAVVPGADGFAKGQGFTDYHNHGTAMASLIAGRGHGPGGRDGILGVAPKSKIMPITVVGPKDRGSRPSVVARGIGHAVDHGADVVLVSLAGPPDSSLDEVVSYAVQHDVLVIASAGQNPNRDVGGPVAFPAGVEGAVAVSAVDRQGRFASWSNSGPKIALALPGVDIPEAHSDGGYGTAWGVSHAAAIAAGMAALIRAKFPDESARDVATRLAYTAADKGPEGRDFKYGFGIPDVNKALTLAEPPTPTASPSAAASTVAGGGADTTAIDAARRARFVRDVVVSLVILVVLAAIVAVALLGYRRRKRARAPAPDSQAAPADLSDPGAGDPPPDTEATWKRPEPPS